MFDKSEADLVLFKRRLSVQRCHPTSSHVPPSPLRRLSTPSTKEDLCISKPAVISRKKADSLSGVGDKKDYCRSLIIHGFCFLLSKKRVCLSLAFIGEAFVVFIS